MGCPVPELLPEAKPPKPGGVGAHRCPDGADPSLISLLEERQGQDPRLRWWQGQRQRGTFGSYRCLMAASRGSFLAQVDAIEELVQEMGGTVIARKA